MGLGVEVEQFICSSMITANGVACFVGASFNVERC
jgi:hypothetical protein